MSVALNKPLPEFEAIATNHVTVTQESHKGKVLVLFFYPKDNTPGCTTEAMAFRDKYKEFVKAGAEVFGVSRDNMRSHDNFKAKLELPYELISDNEEKLCHGFGVVKNKIMYGKKVKGIERSTFLVDEKGVLVQEWRGIKVPGHVDEVLAAVKALTQGSSKKATKPAAKPATKPAAKKAVAKKAATTKTAAKPAVKKAAETKPAAKKAVAKKAVTTKTAAKPAVKKAAEAKPAAKKAVAKKAATAPKTSSPAAAKKVPAKKAVKKKT